MEHDVEIDALGLLCPLPVLKARKGLMGMPEGAVLRILADDPAAVIDMPHFCATAGHRLIAVEETRGGRAFVIRKGNAPA